MATERCACGKALAAESCPGCAEESETMYWCDVCRRAFALKRCPHCGLKLKKIR